MPVHTLRLPVDRMHQEHRVARGRGERRIDKGRDQFEFLDQRTDDQILSVRRELVDNLESESAFYKRQCLICARDIHACATIVPNGMSRLNRIMGSPIRSVNAIGPVVSGLVKLLAALGKAFGPSKHKVGRSG
jgi:hypothetical protein